jgi:hypothetical protein
VSCPRINLNNKYLLHKFKEVWGSLFSSTTQKTPKPVTAPNVKNPDQRSWLLLRKKPDLIGAIQPRVQLTFNSTHTCYSRRTGNSRRTCYSRRHYLAFSRGQRSVDRHKECPSLWRHCSWGCFIICKTMVPFHYLWIDGGETEKRPPCPLCHRTCKNYV